MDWQLISTAIAAFALLALCVQVWLLWRQIIADHERRKKQATVEFIRDLRIIWIELRTKLEKEYGQDTLSKNDVEGIIADPLKDNVVVSLLGSMENLAVGINSGVYDIHLLYRMSGS